MNDMANKLLTIGIRRYLVTQPRTKRTRKAAVYIRERISHYMKIDIDKVRFSRELSDAITMRAKRMLPVKLSIEIEKGIATATPFKEREPQQTPPKTAEKKQAAKAENKEPANKGNAQAAKAKPAPERAQKGPESAARTADAAHIEKSPRNESESTSRTSDSQK
jgi:ribosomal protein L31E